MQDAHTLLNTCPRSDNGRPGRESRHGPSSLSLPYYPGLDQGRVYGLHCREKKEGGSTRMTAYKPDESHEGMGMLS